MSRTSDLLELKWQNFLRPVFNPGITNTTTVFSYAFERDKVFMNTLFKLIVEIAKREAGRTGRFTDLAQI